MVANASSNGSPDSNEQHGEKRKADDGDSGGQTHTRSKRNRYISIACNECKRRKIKCNGQTPCHRCGNLNLECIYAPNCCTSTLKDSAEFQQMRNHITTLQEQVSDLYAQLNELRSRTDGSYPAPPDPIFSHESHSRPLSSSRTLPPLVSPKRHPQQRVLPQFHGPTSSTYGFDVAKSSLQTMGITNNNNNIDEGLISRDRSRPASPMMPVTTHPAKDPLWLIGYSEVKRLLDVYEEEIGIMYPMYDKHKILKHATGLYKFIGASLRTGFGHPSFPGADAFDDDDTVVLKMILAITMVVEGNGRSEQGQRFFDSAKPTVDLKLVTNTGMLSVVLLVLTATYYFQKDEESQAWRFIGIAARICIEMGLHRRDSLLKSFTNEAEYQQAIRTFWIVYALDRRWSFGTGMPFALQDADIDPSLPEPDDAYPYLKHITKYNQIATKVWYHNIAYEGGQNTKKDEIGFLDYQIVSWYQELPPELQFNSRDLRRENEISSRGQRRLRMLMNLRKNQARISIYRPILHSATSIMENRHYAQQVVDVAKETITTLTGINQISDIYRTQQVLYNYFLVQALAVLFLSVAHAPAVFCNQTRQEFYAAIELIKGFSTKSHVSKRLWRTIKGLKDMGDKISMLERGANGSHDQDVDPHSDAAVAMVGMAGHNIHYSSESRHGSVDQLGVSPENALQMTNELSNLFELAGNCGNFNGATPGPDGYGSGYTPNGDGAGVEFNPPFQNEPEFSRIMNELF